MALASPYEVGSADDQPLFLQGADPWRRRAVEASYQEKHGCGVVVAALYGVGADQNYDIWTHRGPPVPRARFCCFNGTGKGNSAVGHNDLGTVMQIAAKEVLNASPAHARSPRRASRGRPAPRGYRSQHRDAYGDVGSLSARARRGASTRRRASRETSRTTGPSRVSWPGTSARLLLPRPTSRRPAAGRTRRPIATTTRARAPSA
mmetsp:Transcript_24123/g.72379  ORF Transcript_24123/g.72379 Transcript_24123/m.72379 type:complete len:205 (+) Transcript_24123:1210-1824(+)